MFNAAIAADAGDIHGVAISCIASTHGTGHASARTLAGRGASIASIWLWVVGILLSHALLGQSLRVVGAPAPFAITAAVAGSPPTSPAADASTLYTVRTRFSRPKKIIAQLNMNMPAGLTLRVNLSPVGGSSSAETVTLTTVPQAVVNNITNNSNLSNTITYSLSATTAAGVVPGQNRSVTFTLTAFPQL